MAQLNNFTAREYLHPGKNTIPGKKITGSCKIVTWNMQGAGNWELAKQFLNFRKPAILCLLEPKITEENKKQFFNKNYNIFTKTGNNDVITFIRKDYSAKIINDDTREDISHLVTEVSAEGDKIIIINIYARDGKLKGKYLDYFFEKYRKIIIAGDLNAKHADIRKKSHIIEMVSS